MNVTDIDNTGASGGNLKSCIVGFILSIVLTAIPFVVVMSGMMPRSVILFCIFGAAIIQILVHLHYFLHLDASSAARWNILVLLFTLLIMILFVGGSIWIMHNLNYRMM